MIIKGVVIKNAEDMDEKSLEAIAELIDDEGLSEGVDNEVLAELDPEVLFGTVGNGTDEDFEVTFNNKLKTKLKEFRFVHDDELMDAVDNAVEENFDDSAWRDAVWEQETEDGFDEWQSELRNSDDYGKIFESVNDTYEEYGEYTVVQVK